MEDIIKNLRRGNVTSKNRILNEDLKYICEAIGGHLLQLYQDCWEEGVFSRVWKGAKLVWIPKKDGSPRPISLLPTLGKVLDKIANKRLKHHIMEKQSQVHERQCAYHQDIETSHAFRNRAVEQNKQEKKHQLTIVLDLSNAFNTTRRGYLILQNGYINVKQTCKQKNG